MVDLPDYERIEDETFPPFPPPASPEREDGEGAEPEEESGRGASVPVPPKRTVKRNIPKLNAERYIYYFLKHLYFAFHHLFHLTLQAFGWGDFGIRYF